MTALYEPLLDLVRQCCQIPLRADVSRLRPALDAGLRALELDPSAVGAYLGQVLGLSEEALLLRDLSPQVLQGRVFEAMHQVFLQSAKQQPLVLEVEDIHWIAQSPEAYLSGLVSRVGDAPLLLLLTYRPEYQPNWLRRARVTQLALRPLLPEDSARVVQAPHRQMPLSADAVAQILSRAQGNPLFLEELTQGIVDHASRLDATALPPTLQAMFSARIDRVAPDAKRLLQLAAVVGQEAPYALIRALMKLPEAALMTRLEELQAHELLLQTQVLPEVVYGFRHALTREAAYGMLRQWVRRDYHGEVAQVLESAFPEMVLAQPEVLAHHYTEAGMTEQAVSYWQEAGQRATDHFPYAEAVAYFRQGLELLQAQPETPEQARRELQLLLLLGPAMGVGQGLATPQREQCYAWVHALS
jgi:predicted ATPase